MRTFLKWALTVGMGLAAGAWSARVEAQAAGKAQSDYDQAMSAGTTARFRYQRKCITAAIVAARAEFQKAIELAANDGEKAAALLALADAWRADVQATDYALIRRIYEQVPHLKGAWSRHKGMAALASGETWHLEKQYERAREAYARAVGFSQHPSILQAACCAAARTYLREGKHQAAREEIERLLAKKWAEQDEPLKEEARALLEVIRLTETWARKAGAAAVESARDREAAASKPPDIEYVIRNLRCDRPRLFLNREILEKIKREDLTPEQQKWLQALKKKVDGSRAPPKMDDKLVARMLSDEGGTLYVPGVAPRVNDGHWGHYAAHAALAYLLTGERAYYTKAVEYLRYAIDEWELIRRNHRIPQSRAFLKLNALAAYDWLYNDLAPAERAEIGRRMFTTLHYFYWYWRGRERPLRKSYPYRLGSMSYSDNNLGWYLGLVFAGAGIEGVEDEECMELLRDEYGQFAGYLREEVPEPDGIKLEGAIGYYTQKLGVKINFLDSWRSAVGSNFARHCPRLAWFGNYTLWNTIAPTLAQPLHHGWSDKYHTDNRIGPHHHAPLMRVAGLFADAGVLTELDEVAAIAQAQVRPGYEQFLDVDQYLTPASPLLMSARVFAREQIEAALTRLPRARHFPDPVGQTFMNSGWGEHDTYALFIAGRQSSARKHFDENHFTIYKKGFLAMDTGARGAGADAAERIAASEKAGHGVNYYYDSVAHNCVLIHMKGEQFPGFWGQKSTVNTGGMNRNHGAQVLAFESDAHYTYIASDATGCYHTDKAAEVVRQFLFVYPDYFAVFDRVASKRPEQKKTWLFHTQMEPVEAGDTFRAEHRGGAIFVRTLLPRDRKSQKIGGPDKEFWADGRNWPLNKHMQGYMHKDNQPTPERHLFGQWRMEITASSVRERELFLHLIQVGDRAQMQKMTPTQLTEDEKTAGVEFQAGERTVRVVFNKEGFVGGQIKIAEGGKVLAERPLATIVQRQKGLALVK